MISTIHNDGGDGFGPGRLREDSQCAKILTVLKAMATETDPWVPMPSLVLASGSYNIHSRIDELRKRGYNIENQTDLSVRPHVSKYRLIKEVA